MITWSANYCKKLCRVEIFRLEWPAKCNCIAILAPDWLKEKNIYLQYFVIVEFLIVLFGALLFFLNWIYMNYLVGFYYQNNICQVEKERWRSERKNAAKRFRGWWAGKRRKLVQVTKITTISNKCKFSSSRFRDKSDQSDNGEQSRWFNKKREKSHSTGSAGVRYGL